MEEISKEVIFGALHREMVVMSGPQTITSHYKLDIFLRKDSLSNNTLCDSGIFHYDEVCSLSMNFTWDTHVLHFGFKDQIEIWLEESFMRRYLLSNECHIMFFVNANSYGLIISFFLDMVLRFKILIYDSYLVARLELLRWLHWIYDQT